MIRLVKARARATGITAAAMSAALSCVDVPATALVGAGNVNQLLYVPADHIFIPRCIMAKLTPSGGENVVNLELGLGTYPDDILGGGVGQGIIKLAFAGAAPANVAQVAYIDLEMPIGRDVTIWANGNKNAGVQAAVIELTAIGLVQPRGQLQLQ